MELKAGLKLGQHLSITPKLQQSIKIMQMSRHDLIRTVEQELIENPVLTLVDDQGHINEKEITRIEASTEATTETESYSLDADYNYLDRSNSFSSDHSQWIENLPSNVDPLIELIADQIDLIQLSTAVKKGLYFILGNLDDSGFLDLSLSEVAGACEISEEEALQAFDVLKMLEPVGIGSRNVEECLLLQLENMGMADGLAANIIRKHLELVYKNKLSEIAKIEEVSIMQVNQAVSTIRILKPSPRASLLRNETQYITPDVSIIYDADQKQFVISLNEDGIPKIGVSPFYQMISQEASPKDNESKFLKSKIHDAEWLMKSIEQRRQTLLKVAQVLCKEQKEYLLNGPQYLKPLTMREVASIAGVHESTISRVVNGKYAETPQGLLELKVFFCQSLSASDQNMSATAVKGIIQDLILSEPSEKPLSDQDLVGILKRGHKLEISRRTVAKYRDELGIPSSQDRRRAKSEQVQ